MSNRLRVLRCECLLAHRVSLMRIACCRWVGTLQCYRHRLRQHGWYPAVHHLDAVSTEVRCQSSCLMRARRASQACPSLASLPHAGVGVLCDVMAYSVLDLYNSEFLVGTLPDGITTMTTLRFVGGPAAGACFASAVHALRCCDEFCDKRCNARLCDPPCVAETFTLRSVASREVFRLASAT